MFMLLDAPEIVFLPQQNFAAPVVAEFFFSLLFESVEFDSVYGCSLPATLFLLFSLQKHKHVKSIS